MAIQLCRNLLAVMGERLAPYEVASQHALATLLDPRFKSMGFCNPANQQNAVNRLTAECANIVKERAPVDPSAAAAGTSSSSDSSAVSALSAGIYRGVIGPCTRIK